MTIKISQLGNLTTVYGNTIVPVVANVAGTLTTVKGNLDQLTTFIVGTLPTDVATLYANAIAQGTAINSINTNITAANTAILTSNTGMKGYVDDQITTVSAAINTANIGMKGYVDSIGVIANTVVATANVGMQGYVDQGNTIQTAAIASANLGMVGYVNAVTTAWTANAYQQQALIGNLQTSAYSNANVSSFLPTYSGNVGGIIADGDISVFGVINAGFPSALTFGNVVINAANDANSYVQLNIQNINSFGNLVSADFIATSPDGTDSSKYIDMGINGNNFSSSDWTISGADDGYLYVNTGNLTLGTDTTGTTVAIHVGDTLAENIVTTFSETDVSISANLVVSNVYVPTANNSTGTTGQITYDGNYVYICIGTNNWKRANLAVW